MHARLNYLYMVRFPGKLYTSRPELSDFYTLSRLRYLRSKWLKCKLYFRSKRFWATHLPSTSKVTCMTERVPLPSEKPKT